MLTLADAMLDKFGGDSIEETRDNLARYRDRISQPLGARGVGGATDSTDVVASESATEGATGAFGSGGDD
jgi:hypothetical protein